MENGSLVALSGVSCVFRIKQGFFKFKKYAALRDVSFDIREGETIGIIGKNGAGKSTLLKLISGIIQPDGGTIEFVREDIKASLLSLQAGFDPELSGRTNAILNGMLLGFERRVIEECLPKIVEFAELKDVIDDPIKTYSTGMRARLGFAVGLELAPDILLIDEVLGVGDIRFRQKAIKAMRDKILSTQTVVLVSHEMNTMRQLCDRVVWIENGVTQKVGAAEEVAKEYLQVYGSKE